MGVVNFVFAVPQLQGVEWGWPGRREPDDEHSPALYGGGDSFLFIFFLICIGIPVCCYSASEFGAMGSISFLEFSCPNLLLVFLNLLFVGTCIILFSQVLGLSLGLFVSFLFYLFLYLILG